MREVIRIDGKVSEEKPIEFTHVFWGHEGWHEAEEINPKEIGRIVYLGKCKVDGDMFAVYFTHKTINVFKGNLNSGKY